MAPPARRQTGRFHAQKLVEMRGLEPLTPAMRTPLRLCRHVPLGAVLSVNVAEMDRRDAKRTANANVRFARIAVVIATISVIVSAVGIVVQLLR